jgi:MFS family permease
MSESKPGALAEITQPFVDLVRAPRALWGINLGYLIEGMAYFGMLGYLAIHFSDYVFKGMEHADELSHNMVGVLTAGITISMFFLGFIADRKGVRFALVAAFILLLVGRVLISAAPTALGMGPGLWSPLHLTTMAGILVVVVGYGMYQPAAYAAVRQFTTPKTAGMGFAMLYALMNLGGWLPTFAFLVRDDDFLGLGITGTFWVYTAFTALALLWTYFVLSRDTVEQARIAAREETARIREAETEKEDGPTDDGERKDARDDPGPRKGWVPLHMHGFLLAMAALFWFFHEPPQRYYEVAGVAGGWLLVMAIPASRRWLARHPLSDAKFFFFIFALIPVQTLFTYNWFVLPQYISRTFEGWIGRYFEIAANANPLLIFVAVPVITAISQKARVYNMMIWGTLVMASPAFLLAIGPYWWTLFPYLLIMTIGEAMWQPRFLQYAAEIAPEDRTGEYMGVAQLPWFLTKMLVPWLYSGRLMERYCPAKGPKNTEMMWLIFACIAVSSTVLLLLAKRWVGKDFKTKAD